MAHETALSARFGRIEEKRAALLDRAAAMDPSELVAHPRPGKWSILEILEHLAVAEEDVLGDLSRLDELRARRRRLKHRLRYWVVMLVLRFDIPVRMPSPGMAPSGERSLQEVRELWEENHRELRSWLAGEGRDGAGRALFRHPVAGPLTVSGALRMLEVHLDRHTRQIGVLEGLLAEVGRRGRS